MKTTNDDRQNPLQKSWVKEVSDEVEGDNDDDDNDANNALGVKVFCHSV